MKRLFVSVLFLVSFISLLRAEEGMWTFDNPPVERIRERYGFTLTPEWLEQVRLSSVRFNDGGSGAFVSANGLVLTNHHVAQGQLQKLSSAESNYARDGFHARSLEEELKSPDLELNILMSMEDVTQRVQQAAVGTSDPQAALEAREAEIAAIEKESLETTGLRSNVVTLYSGGEYWLYRYKEYTDVRIVFAPEQQAAYFGGDSDNFTFPRYCLDFALFRVYEDEKPVESSHYLKWNSQGAAQGELVFVPGNPGSTNRLYTIAQLETLRDYYHPLILDFINRRLALLRDYAARGPEEERQAMGQIFSFENALKAYTGELKGLKDPEVMAARQQEETEFRSRIAADPQLKERYLGVWDRLAEAESKYRSGMKAYFFGRFPTGTLAARALAIVQYVTEVAKPDAERLDGFHDSDLASQRFRLLSPAPVYPGLEEAILSDSLKQSLEILGADDPFVRDVLAGRSADEVAHQAVSGTKLADPEFRKSLLEGGQVTVQKSDDPMIRLAIEADPVVRRMRKWYEDEVESIEQAAGEQLGRARFEIYGKSTYPDATFTLRLAYGQVKGYPMNGTVAPPKTTFYGLYNRAYGFDMEPPFDLTQRFVDHRPDIDLSTPMNFVSTCDITGGNSGSPVINARGELVGLIFDGNIESLVAPFVYDEETNRAVSVHSAAIIETLRKVYEAAALADELEVAAVEN